MHLVILFLASWFLSQPICRPPTSTDNKFAPAAFDESEFIATIPDLRTQARFQNERAARLVSANCEVAIRADPAYSTDQEREVAIDARCPRLPALYVVFYAKDVSCEIGEYCGPEFPLSKSDKRSFKAYFNRKIAAVEKAQKLGMHVDQVEAYAVAQAKPPKRLRMFWEFRKVERADTEAPH